jgi:hypothetical protein
MLESARAPIRLIAPNARSVLALNKEVEARIFQVLQYSCGGAFYSFSRDCARRVKGQVGGSASGYQEVATCSIPVSGVIEPLGTNLWLYNYQSCSNIENCKLLREKERNEPCVFGCFATQLEPFLQEVPKLWD